MVALLIFLVLSVVALAIYAFWPRPFPSSGKIIEKWHEEERYWTQFIPMYIGKVMIFLPFFHFDDEDWIIRIEDQDGLQGDVYLTHSAWNKLSIGNFYIINEKDDINDEVEKTEVE
jgi:hypothetical protein